jgi:deoxyribose-phosphate aldolase
MDTQALVDRVTKEVVSALSGAGGAGGTGCCAPGIACSSCGHCAVKRRDVIDGLIAGGASRISAAPGIGAVEASIARMIDHTLLKADAREDEVRVLCQEAATYGFASVCINPSWVVLAARLLRRSGVKVCTVIGFPLGATTAETKAYETRNAIANGASEADMVINIGALKSKDYERVEKDIRAVVRACGPQVLTKVILETSLLSDEEKVKACELAKEAGADFVKTSTGFSKGGATAADIALMRKTVGTEMGIKASGGVRTFDDAQAMIRAGATRIGASASLKIIRAKDVSSAY